MFLVVIAVRIIAVLYIVYVLSAYIQYYYVSSTDMSEAKRSGTNDTAKQNCSQKPFESKALPFSPEQ